MQVKYPFWFKNLVPHSPKHKKRRKEGKNTKILIVFNMKYIKFYLETFGGFKKTLCSEYLLSYFLYNSAKYPTKPLCTCFYV